MYAVRRMRHHDTPYAGPSLRVEVEHRRPSEGRGETITVHMTAEPDFAALARSLQARAALAAPWLGAMDSLMRLSLQMWQPWLRLWSPALMPFGAPAEPPRTETRSAADLQDVEYREIKR